MLLLHARKYIMERERNLPLISALCVCEMAPSTHCEIMTQLDPFVKPWIYFCRALPHHCHLTLR